MTAWARPLLIGLAIVLVASFGAMIQGWRYEAKISDLMASHAAESQEHLQALAHAQNATLVAERELKDTLEQIADETLIQIEAVRAYERDLYDGRVRDIARQYAASYRSHAAATTAAIEREAAGAAITMFAHMLGELEELAGIYSVQADGSRVAGLACEASYQKAREMMASLEKSRRLGQ